MNKKVPCGGFEIDNQTLVEENGVLRAVGGGGGSGALIVNFDVQTETLDKTWQEIHDADFSIIKGDLGVDGIAFYMVKNVVSYDGTYIVMGSEQQMFTTDFSDGYPQFTTQ